MAKEKAGKKKRVTAKVEMAKEKAVIKTQETDQFETKDQAVQRVKTAKEKTDKNAQENTQVETVVQIVQRVKKDMLWVGVCIVVSAAIGLIAGQLIKF
ncbi:MAG TPA: hypothetical protein DCK76_10455 [Desulfotomaculum sp.]|nr:MAG: hypothetical protein XD84_1187 [Desulfotomaculum sp. 46_80]HAG11772.1 hypothetical protein [Desulfotomaculum sp.]HBY03811.1 hypothetical protein [Desulfotomaculum sp.]